MPFLREQLLDTWNIEYGIINPHYMQFIVTARRPSEYTLALARAINDWVLAEWLEPEPRLRAAIVIPYEDADLAVKEIERLGNHPGFIQVLFMVRTAEPLGRRKYWKIYEAAVRHDLPVAIHVGGSNGHPVTAAGWPSFYLEDHVAFSQAAQAQLVSLVCEGVFEQFPTLKIVLMEGGMAWVAPIMWRLDKAWRLLREETPHLKKLPSEYVRQHFWFTTQPIEEPEKPRHFAVMLKHLAMDDRILFATDYPHWDFDAPDQALPVQLDQNLERKIFAENARSLYKL